MVRSKIFRKKVKKIENERNLKFFYFGAAILISIVLFAMITPFFDLIPPDLSSRDSFLKPSRDHILGTNDIGQDIFSRTVYGIKNSVFVSVMVGIMATFISVVLATYSALIGGRFERLVLRIADVFLSIPEFVICLLVSSYLQPNAFVLIALITLLNWQAPLKVIHSQVVVCREKASINAAKTFGAGNTHILKKHILPEIMPIVASTFIRNARIAVFMESSLAYLGMVSPETISLGKIMGNAMEYIYLDLWEWWLLPAGGVLSLFLLSLSYMGFYSENNQNIFKRG